MKNQNALFKLSYGLYVVSSTDGKKGNGQIANAVFQITNTPLQVAVSINKENYTHELISTSKKVSISVLGENCPFKFVGRFGFKSGRDIDKLNGLDLIYENDTPIVRDYAVSYLVGEVVSSADLGTHTVFFTQINNGDVLNDIQPMTYEYYHKVLKGKAPKTAPTFGAM